MGEAWYIERMSLVRGHKEAVVTTSARSTIPDIMAIERTAAVVTSAGSSLCAEKLDFVEGGAPAAGDVVVPVLAVG